MTIASPSQASGDAIVCPLGFVAGGVACGIKPSGNDDLALIQCPEGASAAAVFTRNQFAAAPIAISKAHLIASDGRARALLINAGCANAATGQDGVNRGRRVANALAACLNCPPSEVLINSTGLIGSDLPDDRITSSLPHLVRVCDSDGISSAARAIMTTDTVPKVSQRIVEYNGQSCRVVGMAKGAGMIHPDMATMIAVILTDADLSPSGLDSLLRSAVTRTFNRISVDGDTSTNDAVFALASGVSGEFPEHLIGDAMLRVSQNLAEMIVRDAEGATCLIRVTVRGAAQPTDALQVARAVTGSLLVRTGITSNEPNWGRIVAAVGRSGVSIESDQVSVSVNERLVFTGGEPVRNQASTFQAHPDSGDISILVDLGQGSGSEEILSCDLTEQYVRINADYAT